MLLTVPFFRRTSPSPESPTTASSQSDLAASLRRLVNLLPSTTASPLDTITSLGVFDTLANLPPPGEITALAEEIEQFTKAMTRFSTNVAGASAIRSRSAVTWLDASTLTPTNWLSRLRTDFFSEAALLAIPVHPDTLRRMAALIERANNQARAAAVADPRTWPTAITGLKATLAELTKYC